MPPKAPPLDLPKGREFLLAEFEDVVWCSFLLGKVGMGPAGGWYAPLATPSELLLLEEAPPHALLKGREFFLAEFEVVVWRSLPLGRAGEGLQRGFESSYSLLYIYAREVSVVTVMTALTFVGTNGGGC